MGRLRLRNLHRKRRWIIGVGPERRRGGFWRRLAAILPAALLGVWAISGCQKSHTQREITVAELEGAGPARPTQRQRVQVSDPRALALACPILGERVILIQARNAAEWASVQLAMPELHLTPDFSRGSVIGLASCAGTPVGGEWPIALRTIRVCRGAALVRAEFAAGTYLPDEQTFAEVAFVEGLNTALVIDVNGERYYPN